MQQVKHSQAIKLFRENLAVYERCYGHDHERVLLTQDLITDLQMQHAASINLPAGAQVCISGLVSRPELNRQHKARYAVQLADGKKMLLKPKCSTCT